MQRLIGLEVTGGAMEPTLLEGDVIYIDQSIKPHSNAKDVAVLKVRENYHVCKFTVYGSQLLMIHDNAPIKVVNLKDVEIVGKVIEVAFEPEIVLGREESHIAGNDVALV